MLSFLTGGFWTESFSSTSPQAGLALVDALVNLLAIRNANSFKKFPCLVRLLGLWVRLDAAREGLVLRRLDLHRRYSPSRGRGGHRARLLVRWLACMSEPASANAETSSATIQRAHVFSRDSLHRSSIVTVPHYVTSCYQTFQIMGLVPLPK